MLLSVMVTKGKYCFVREHKRNYILLHSNTVKTLKGLRQTRLERCTLWSTQKFQRYSWSHIMDDSDISRLLNNHSSKELWTYITYSKGMEKATTVSKGNNGIQGRYCDNVIWGHCWSNNGLGFTVATICSNNEPILLQCVPTMIPDSTVSTKCSNNE